MGSKVTDRIHPRKRLSGRARGEGSSYWLQLASETHTVAKHELRDKKVDSASAKSNDTSQGDRCSAEKHEQADSSAKSIGRKPSSKTSVSRVADPIIPPKKKKELEPEWLFDENSRIEFADAFKFSATAMLITDEDGLIYGANESAGNFYR